MGTSAGQKQSGPAPELIRGASGVRLVSVPLRTQEPCLLGDPSLQHSTQTYWSCRPTKRTWQPCLGSWHPDWVCSCSLHLPRASAQAEEGARCPSPEVGLAPWLMAFAKAVGGQPPQLYGAGVLSLTPFSLKGTAHRRVQAGHGNTVHAPAIATALQLVPPPPSASHCPWPSPLYRVRLWRLGSECNL